MRRQNDYAGVFFATDAQAYKRGRLGKQLIEVLEGPQAAPPVPVPLKAVLTLPNLPGPDSCIEWPRRYVQV